MNISAKKILLPHLELTEVATADDHEATAVMVPSLTNNPVCETYYIKAKSGTYENKAARFNYFPVVLGSNGAPWAEAVVYILSRLDSVSVPTMSTYTGIADDLAAFRRFLDETGIDWMHFPSQKMFRPTYRFNGYLKIAVQSGKVAAGTAQRRMGTVIRFYRWLISEKVLAPEHPPWKESDRYIDFRDSHGFERTKQIVTTDVSLKTPKQHDPYDGAIDDGGKLRPLPLTEQEWVMDALITLGNTEMTLIHLFGFLTGARIQTILTFRVRHVDVKLDGDQQGFIRVPVGLGTGIDTKNGKRQVLHIPVYFYKMLYVYSQSGRAVKRRQKANGGDHKDQYLFLSAKGTPLYQSKEETSFFNPINNLRHIKTGQAVRQFITEYVIPFVRSKYATKDFHYQFHDTRATAGMNWTDHQLKLVEQGLTTLHEAREFVKVRMGHQSALTTDRYLQYRMNLKLVRWAGIEYECHLQKISKQALAGTE